MKFKRNIVRALLLAAVLSVTPLFAQTAKASDATKPTFLGVTGEVKVEAAYKFWAFAKQAKNEKAANLKNGASDDLYTISELNSIETTKVDLSSIKKNKEIIIAVGKTDTVTDGFYVKTDWEIVKIEAEKANFKVEYLVTKPEATILAKTIQSSFGYILATVDGNPVDLVGTDAEKIEARTELGKWKTVKSFFSKDGGTAPITGATGGDAVLQMFTQKGAKLFFRIAGVDGKGDAPIGTWPSKEVSLKINAQDKAPKVTINNAKHEITFKKGMVFNVNENGKLPTDATTWKTATPGKVSLAHASIGVTGEATKYILVKTAATDKKMDSKVTKIKLNHQAKPTAAALSDKSNGNVIASKVTFALKVPYNLKKGGLLTNTSTDDYEVHLTTADEPAKDAKWLKLKAQKPAAGKKAAKPGTLVLRYTEDGKANTFGSDDTKIFLRLIGSKKIEAGELKMYSLPSDKVAFKPKADEQEFSVTGLDTVDYKVGKDMTFKGTVDLTNLFKDGLKPKVKVTSALSGVTVKVDKMKKGTGKGTATIYVTIKKSAAKQATDINGKELKFTLNGEGAPALEHTVTVNAS